MALNYTDLKKGTIFQMDGVPYKVLEYTQKVMGRGSSNVNVKIRNLIDGKILDKTFKGSENIDSASVTNRPMQHLYNDAGGYHFMDTENYEQFSLSSVNMEDKKGYMSEGDVVTAQFFDSQLINIELPKNLPLKVTYTEDAVRGDTSTAITKNATLETGLVVKVPAFIKQGDVISVDTTTGAYRAREKS
ncbi:MAG TPA: elongation factor P [Candidatus Saccharimonadales bacterium]|nr:elongation factor P [Candidatus Saccharimonadales bacterium]